MGRRRKRDPLDELTRREREVLELMAEGLSNYGICRKLVLSPKTVELPQEPDEHRRVLAVLAFRS
jgi:DNA-binding NarL/FixJ family response regulator